MNPGWDKDDRLVGSKFNNFLITERESFSDLEALFSLMGRDDNKIENSSFESFIEKVLSKEDIFVILVLLIERTDIFSALLIAVWISKCELHTFYEFIEHVVEF